MQMSVLRGDVLLNGSRPSGVGLQAPSQEIVSDGLKIWQRETV